MTSLERGQCSHYGREGGPQLMAHVGSNKIAAGLDVPTIVANLQTVVANLPAVPTGCLSDDSKLAVNLDE